ncbi:hypothetical protein GCM10009718_27800 [Isoptericola halotolerans]|uniref:DUF5979 domain-containing protein n=1 Tax=Isoptericola halotolerans TaxID=300560 RepID=UPI0031DA76B6
MAVPATSASAATWGIQKMETSAGPYAPGQDVQWLVTVSCSDPNQDPCTNAVLSDPMPDGVELVSATIQNQGSSDGQIDADLETDTVTYTAPSVDNGTQVQIAITGRIDPDLPYSASGVPITNTATVDADNADEVSAEDDIVPVVELVLGSETTKSIDPGGALAEPGTPATMTLGATNTSNDAVDTLVVQDPADPTADPNPFDYLEYTGTGDITLPPDADTVTTEYWDGDSWETLDGAVDPSTVQGVRYTFSGDIQPGATATIPVEVQQSEAVTELTEATTVVNEVSSYVTHPEGDSEPTTAQDDYVITPPNNAVTASKSFDPATVSAGDPTTVTLGATNDGTQVGSLTITEPSPGTDSPFEGESALTFTGFGTDGAGAGIVWPADATEVTVTFTCADGATSSESTTTANTLPAPPDGCELVGFSVEFTGDIVSSAEATIPFTADTDPDQQLDDVTHTNQITAQVPNAEDTATAELVTLNDRLATETTKSITPSTIPAVPGQGVIVQLPTQLLPFGPDGSTTNADQIVVQDPTDPANPSSFWDSFAPTEVRSTDVPADATLTVSYWDGSDWVAAPGCGPYTGPDTVSCDLPDGAEGVQLVYDSTGNGFAPGTQVQPNLVATFTGSTDQDETLANCAASTASSEAVGTTEPSEACAEVTLEPVDPGVGPDLLDKEFLDNPADVVARSDEQATARLTWSTGGFSGMEQVVVQDTADPVAGDDPAIADSFFDAFDLVSIAADDPLLPYDQIESVELFVDGAWVAATGDPCPCDGGFPGYTLTEAEQESATSVRLTYVESPTRGTGDPVAPQPGDGVARSTQSDGRHLDLTFQVRDTKRSDGSPALGTTNGTVYNAGDAGLVNDTARGTATLGESEYTDVDDDDVTIIDQPLNVAVAKDWTGGPISVPPAGTPAALYPSTTATITGTNTSAAKVDQLRLAEPGIPGSGDVQTAEGTRPFDDFTLTAIDLTPPAGTDEITVTLTTWDGATTTSTDHVVEADGTGLPADLSDVVGVEVAFDGLVEAGADGVLDLTLQLREADRYTGESITLDTLESNPVPNGAVATITDPGGTGDDVRLAYDDATMELQDAEIDLEVGKSFEPGEIVEPGTGPVTMTLSGRPLGPSRTVEMVLTDDDPQFWNQYDVAGFDGATLTAPIEQVQVDAFTGATFTGEAGSSDPVEVDGGTWVEGTPSATFELPDGVAPGDVQGLRFTFTRADGSVWENPALPLQEVPISVERRLEMRSGGAVQHDLVGNDPAPGESAPGVASNTVDGQVTGADLVVDPETGEPVPVSATDAADAEIVYVHATNAVEIVKNFDDVVSGGTQTPNGVFPMNITVTNTGDRAIVDPVMVDDPMPSDGDGAQLRLADVDEPFSYVLDGAAPDPANGPALPTDPADVTVDQTGDLEALEFSFPDGSVLEVGQSYTITVQVQFRLGLPAQTLVQNTAGVTGDRPWDACESRLDDETGACEADADVTPIPAAVLSQTKQVKATEDDQLDVIVDPAASNPPAECVPDADGFYSYPCTPVIAPGHNETWRIEINNVGNLPMDKLVIYDRLPTPGDTGSYASSARNSAWGPYLTTDPPPELVNAPEGSEVSFAYSTVQDYCMDDLEDAANEPLCPTDDPETGWVQLTGTESDELFASITAIKIVITFPEDDLFQPGDHVDLDGTTTTPPVAPEAGDLSIAWNSAAASGSVISNGSTVSMLPTEGTKVGVATATGSLAVDKEVTGPGQAYAPDSFELTVECVSAVGTWVEAELDPITVTVTPGEPVTVPNLPYGAECTLTEGDNGQSSFTTETVTIGQEPDVAEITATNDYQLTGLDLAKLVESDAVDATGGAVPYGPFEVMVECTFLGETIYADGYDAENPMVLTLEGGAAPVVLDGLPVGTECTVTETDTMSAASTSIEVSQDGTDPVVTDGTSTTVVLTGLPDTAEEIPTSVEITNVYEVGTLGLLKVVNGDGADGYGAGPFVLDVVCVLTGTEPDPRVVYDGSVVLGGAGPLEAQITHLAAGAECTVTESEDGGATSTVVTPEAVAVDAGETVEVEVVNTFDVGSIQVEKIVAGDAAEFAVGPFEVLLECSWQGEDLPIPGGAARELEPGDPVTYDGLPVGADCVVTETVDGGATSVEVSTVDDGAPGAVTIGTEPAEVTVTNTFDAGTVQVDKVVDGDAAQYATGPYEVVLECTFGGEEVDVPGGAARELVPGEPVLYEGLPVGAACAVTETDDGGATGVVIAPESVTVGAEPVEVVVTNRFDLGQVAVTKVVDGPGAEFGVGPFEVALECTFRDQPVEVPDGATRVLEADGTVTYAGLPVGSDCLVTEIDTYGATSSHLTTTVGDGVPGQVVVPAAGADPAVVTVTNTYEVGSVQVDKVVDGPGAELWGAGPFEVTLECTFGGEEIEVPGGAARVLVPGEPASYHGLPDGAECVVTETRDGDAVEVAVSAVDDGAPGAVVVAAGETGEVTVTNTFELGSVEVDKVVEGPGAEQQGAGPFEVTLECTFVGESIDVPGGAVRELVPGDAVGYERLPVGADCLVTETDDGGADATTVSAVDGGAPGAVFVSSGEATAVTVTNTFGPVPSEPGTGGSDPGAEGTGGNVSGGGDLPRTGVAVAGVLGLVVLLLAAGVLLLTVRRRQES